MAIYMQIQGIKGNVEADGHKDWIELGSLQWGVGRGIATATGTSKDREASAPSISEVVVTKQLDLASPYIFSEACVGKSKPIVIHLCKTDATKLETYLEYTLTNSLISGYSVSSGGDRPTESISINFTKVEMKYIPWKDDHTMDSPIPVGYDMATAKKV
jgi:type VI secretion system secreted protein Hcp